MKITGERDNWNNFFKFKARYTVWTRPWTEMPIPLRSQEKFGFPSEVSIEFFPGFVAI